MTSTPLSRAIKARRIALGYKSVNSAAEAARIPEATWRRIEREGTPPRSLQTRNDLAAFLGWTLDSIDRVAEGGRASIAEAREAATLEDVRDEVRLLRREVAKLARLLHDDQTAD